MRLVAHHLSLVSRVRVTITPCGFHDGRNGIWVDFSGDFSHLLCHKFHSVISPRSSRSFHFMRRDSSLHCKQGLNRCGSFPLFSSSHSLFSIWIHLERSETIPGAPTWRWGEWIWLTGPSGLRRNSPQGFNISSIRVFYQIRDPEIPITLRPIDIDWST